MKRSTGNPAAGLSPAGYGLAEVTLLPEMLLPETLLEIVPDELALPLVPPVVVLTLTPLALVLVSVVVIFAEVLTDVEQAPLHDAFPLVATVPVASETVLRAWLRTPSPFAKTGADATSVNAEATAIHTIILRFMSISRFSQTSRPDLPILPDRTPALHDKFASRCIVSEQRGLDSRDRALHHSAPIS